jgi:hypothetical protein
MMSELRAWRATSPRSGSAAPAPCTTNIEVRPRGGAITVTRSVHEAYTHAPAIGCPVCVCAPLSTTSPPMQRTWGTALARVVRDDAAGVSC